ncbi:hypothetical protein D3M96_08515 [Alcaligenes aquatilis]|uniref:Uncharacterized protein n=1 Tax=Alcaligenes aquatilis TaxID=323284 RepID=A0A3G2HTT7_9BURK|nr:hypothetical protein D3M96_08515 [Alcaligenes aquatilis]
MRPARRKLRLACVGHRISRSVFRLAHERRTGHRTDPLWRYG